MTRIRPTSAVFAGKTRAQRFLILRDMILEHSGVMRSDGRGTKRLDCGPFWILFSYPGVVDRTRCNMEIWPGGAEDGGHIMHRDKVANVSWDHQDKVEITSYRSGPWEDELLRLLASEGNVAFFSPRGIRGA